MDIAKNVGVQSYCFRGFKENEKVAELVKQCGLSKIELCGVHVNFDDAASVDSAIAAYKKAGVQIISLGVEGFSNNEKREVNRFEFAKKAGAKVITASFDINSVPACYRTAEKLADKYDVVLAIHNHGAGDWLGNSTVLSHVFANTSERIGLCLDTAWALHSHANPVNMAKQFSKRLYGLHIKDFVFDRAGNPSDVVVGQGNLELDKLMALLAEVKFSGAAVIEFEGSVENPVPALKECVAAIHKAGK